MRKDLLLHILKGLQELRRLPTKWPPRSVHASPPSFDLLTPRTIATCAVSHCDMIRRAQVNSSRACDYLRAVQAVQYFLRVALARICCTSAETCRDGRPFGRLPVQPCFHLFSSDNARQSSIINKSLFGEQHS